MLVPGAATARPDVGGSETGQTSGVSIHGSQTRDLVWNTDGLNMTVEHRLGRCVGPVSEPGRLPGSRGADARAAGGNWRRRRQREHDHARTAATRCAASCSPPIPASRSRAATSSPEQTAPRPGRAERDRRVLRYQRRRRRPGRSRASCGSSPAARRFRVDRFEANTFNPDGSQSLDENLIWNATGKLTWQINPANRLSSFVDYNYKLRDHRRQTTTQYQFVSPEASYYSPLSGPVANVKLTSTLRPNLLSIPASRWYHVPWSLDYQPDLRGRRAAACRPLAVDADGRRRRRR